MKIWRADEDLAGGVRLTRTVWMAWEMGGISGGGRLTAQEPIIHRLLFCCLVSEFVNPQEQ